MITLALLLASSVVFLMLALRDWYKGVCVLIVLMAVLEHPDMPKTMFEVQGLNVWNVILVAVLLGWLRRRRAEGCVWDLPPIVTILGLGYIAVVVVACARMMADAQSILDMTTGTLVSEYCINPIKWLIPAILLYDGCRTRSRCMLAIAAIAIMYLLLGVQVVRWIPPSAAVSGETLAAASLKATQNEIGYHRVDLSSMLAGASWAILAVRPLASTGLTRALIVLSALLMVYAQALTAGRMGYVAWVIVGLVMGFVRWRRQLLFVPLVAFAIVSAVPAVQERMLQGFSPESRDYNPRINSPAVVILGETSAGPDEYTVTAGRNVAWKYISEKIDEAPLLGHGRLAMQRTGLTSLLFNTFGEEFPHPHNAYLELLLDNGWFGLLLVLSFYLVILYQSLSLLINSRHPLFLAAGGVASSLVLAHLVASYGSQSFYPREGMVAMFCGMGVALRVAVQRRQQRSQASAPGMAETAPVELVPDRPGVIQAGWWKRKPPPAAVRASEHIFLEPTA